MGHMLDAAAESDDAMNGGQGGYVADDAAAAALTSLHAGGMPSSLQLGAAPHAAVGDGYEGDTGGSGDDEVRSRRPRRVRRKVVRSDADGVVEGSDDGD